MKFWRCWYHFPRFPAVDLKVGEGLRKITDAMSMKDGTAMDLQACDGAHDIYYGPFHNGIEFAKKYEVA